MQTDYIEFTDDFMFCEVLTRYPDICRRILEAVLDRKVELVSTEKQKQFRINKDSKSIRTDIFVDGGTEIFDIEMQVVKNEELPKRTRYYQGVMDLEEINAGAAYTELRRSYIIFIVPDDVFGRGRMMYTFENICSEDTAVKLGDETIKMFLCAGGTISEGLSDKAKELLAYVKTGAANGDLTNDIKRRVDAINNDKDWRENHMLFIQELDIRERRGFAAGEAKKAAKIAHRMFKRGDAIPSIAEVLEISEEEVKRILSEAAPED